MHAIKISLRRQLKVGKIPPAEVRQDSLDTKMLTLNPFPLTTVLQQMAKIQKKYINEN